MNCPDFDLFGGYACKAICIIPARGGSKRIPHKNIRPIAGTPVICHTIFTAFDSGIFSSVYVSTDSKEISDISRDAGAQIINRDEKTAGDHAPISSAVRHAIQCLDYTGIVAMIYPVSPLMTIEHLRSGYVRYLSHLKGSIDYVMSVTRIDSRCLRSFMLDPSPVMISPAHAASRSQDLPYVFADAAMFVFGHSETWLKNAPIFPNTRTRGHIIDSKYVIDVDTESDWQRLEAAFA